MAFWRRGYQVSRSHENLASASAIEAWNWNAPIISTMGSKPLKFMFSKNATKLRNLHRWFEVFLKVRKFRKDFCSPWILPKNERTNSFSTTMNSFVRFWENSRIPIRNYLTFSKCQIDGDDVIIFCCLLRKHVFSKKATKNYNIITVDLTLTKGQIVSNWYPRIFPKTNKRIHRSGKRIRSFIFWENSRRTKVLSKFSDL